MNSELRFPQDLLVDHRIVFGQRFFRHDLSRSEAFLPVYLTVGREPHKNQAARSIRKTNPASSEEEQRGQR